MSNVVLVSIIAHLPDFLNFNQSIPVFRNETGTIVARNQPSFKSMLNPFKDKLDVKGAWQHKPQRAAVLGGICDGKV